MNNGAILQCCACGAYSYRFPSKGISIMWACNCKASPMVGRGIIPAGVLVVIKDDNIKIKKTVRAKWYDCGWM